MKERLETLSVRESYALAAVSMGYPPEKAADAIKSILSLPDCTLHPAGSYEDLGKYSQKGAARKENIIIGLENYIIDLAGQFSEINQEALDSGLGACESIAAGFQEMWTDPVHTRRVETIQTPSQVLT